MDLRPGLYESLVTNEIATALDAVPDELIERRTLAADEAADRIALYLSREVRRSLTDVHDDDRVAVGLRVAQRLFDELGLLAPVEPAARAADSGDILRAV